MEYCLILDKHRGVYCGVVDYDSFSKNPQNWILVTEFRHCFSFSAGGCGVYGLAINPPDKTSKIGPVIPGVIITDVSKVMIVSKIAEEGLRSAAWAK